MKKYIIIAVVVVVIIAIGVWFRFGQNTVVAPTQDSVATNTALGGSTEGVATTSSVVTPGKVAPKLEVGQITKSPESILPLVPGTLGSNAPIVVYKTKGAYENLVAVVLSKDKLKIVAYPGPSDIVHEAPIPLHSDYFIALMPGAGSLDGAFLNLNDAKYSKMPEFTYTPGQLYNMIFDQNPFTEMYDCTKATIQKTAVSDIDSWIDNNQLATMCVKLK